MVQWSNVCLHGESVGTSYADEAGAGRCSQAGGQAGRQAASAGERQGSRVLRHRTARLRACWRFAAGAVAHTTDAHCTSIMASSISFGDANAGFQAGVINGSVSTTHVYSPGKSRLAAAARRPPLTAFPLCSQAGDSTEPIGRTALSPRSRLCRARDDTRPGPSEMRCARPVGCARRPRRRRVSRGNLTATRG